MKVLIAYDGSKCADAALDDLTHAGLAEKGEALVMSVAEVWLPPPSPFGPEVVEVKTTTTARLLERTYVQASQAVKDADDLAVKAAARFQANFPKWKVRHKAIWGSPSWEIFSESEEWKSDLIVAGSHGRSAIGRLLLGSISQWVLNQARCSVRVARGVVDEPDFPVRLLLGLDGSRSAEKALEEIIARNWPAKSEVRVIVVEQPLELAFVSGVPTELRKSVTVYNKKEHGRWQQLINTTVKKLKAAGLRASGELISGDPKQLLLETAEQWRADCIFLGATGVTNRWERFLLGSTAAAVAARAHCSVEVVRKRRRSRKANANGHGQNSSD